MTATKLTQQQLEAHLWGAANILRGKTAGQDYKNYILSLMFYKRLSDQWENEADDAILELERQQGRVFTDSQKAIFRARGEHRFTIPEGSRWGDVLAASTNLGQKLTSAMRAVADANEELRGVFTVDWNQPAPDGSGKPLIPNEVVHALVQHFNDVDLSNRTVPPDILGRAYEYLIKQFADDAGAKAGEFFTPPEVVDILVRILEPEPGNTIYDPTGGSGGMLVHAADFLREQGHHATSAQYFAQEMNWSNAAIAKINSVLHGLEASIAAGTSTITDPAFTDQKGKVRKFSLVLANFPFSDEFWWLKPEQQTDDKKKKEKLKKEIFGKEGYKDPYGRFGRGTPYNAPPAGSGDYAFVLHILASLTDIGRAGIVCPQSVLFRGQPDTEEETGELDETGNPIIKRRKANDEHLIRKALLQSQVIDAVISLPLNVFYGSGVPACLLILRKQRPTTRKNKVLLVYAGRHFRALSNQNELRPQDVMRILVHYHAYGEQSKVAQLTAHHKRRVRKQIDAREHDETERLRAQFSDYSRKMTELRDQIAKAEADASCSTSKTTLKKAEAWLAKLRTQYDKAATKIAERDKNISESRSRAEEDRRELEQVGAELEAIYADSDELVRHAKVVDISDIEENEFNLNIPLYLDTFEPETVMDAKDTISMIAQVEQMATAATNDLTGLLSRIQGIFVTGIDGGPQKKTQIGPIPQSWDVKSVGDVVTDFEYGLSVPMSLKGDTPILRMGNIQSGDVVLDDLKFVTLPEELLARFMLRRGDVLFNRTNSQEHVGKVGIYRSDEPAVFASYLIRLHCDPSQINNYFIAHLLNSYAVQCRIKRYATPGVQQVNINATNLSKVLIPVPSGRTGLQEQSEIADLLETWHCRIRSYFGILQKLDQIKKALLHNVFTGAMAATELGIRKPIEHLTTSESKPIDRPQQNEPKYIKT